MERLDSNISDLSEEVKDISPAISYGLSQSSNSFSKSGPSSVYSAGKSFDKIRRKRNKTPKYKNISRSQEHFFRRPQVESSVDANSSYMFGQDSSEKS